MIHQHGIIGYGVVGKAIHKGILKNAPAVLFDTAMPSNLDGFEYVKFIHFCVPTNTYKDIDVIVDYIDLLKVKNKDAVFFVHSTLPVGASEYILEHTDVNVVYIPEFLRERYWEEDCKRRPIVVGYNALKSVPEFLRFDNIIFCSNVEAELIKMYANNMASIRITFANKMYELAQAHNANYETVKGGYLEVHHKDLYLDVPGHDGSKGFGGKCLPKDLDFLINSLIEADIDTELFTAIRNTNKGLRE